MNTSTPDWVGPAGRCLLAWTEARLLLPCVAGAGEQSASVLFTLATGYHTHTSHVMSREQLWQKLQWQPRTQSKSYFCFSSNLARHFTTHVGQVLQSLQHSALPASWGEDSHWTGLVEVQHYIGIARYILTNLGLPPTGCRQNRGEGEHSST